MIEFNIKKKFKRLKRLEARKVYNELIDFARKRRQNNGIHFDDYFEMHHIHPKCLGGGEGMNLIALSATEHCFAHYLLASMHPRNKQLALAFYLMSRRTINTVNYEDFNNYAKLRIKASEFTKEMWESEEIFRDGMTYKEFQLYVVLPKIQESREKHLREDEEFKKRYIMNSFGNGKRQFLNAQCRIQKQILNTLDVLSSKRLKFTEKNWNKCKTKMTPTFTTLIFQYAYILETLDMSKKQLFNLQKQYYSNPKDKLLWVNCNDYNIEKIKNYVSRV